MNQFQGQMEGSRNWPNGMLREAVRPFRLWTASNHEEMLALARMKCPVAM